jgi:hypothetical protein
VSMKKSVKQTVSMKKICKAVSVTDIQATGGFNKVLKILILNENNKINSDYLYLTNLMQSHRCSWEDAVLGILEPLVYTEMLNQSTH